MLRYRVFQLGRRSLGTLAADGVMFPRLGAKKPAYGISAAAGVLDWVANLLFLVTALYPAGPVLLARTVLGERIHRAQLLGLGTAAVAVSLLAPT